MLELARLCDMPAWQEKGVEVELRDGTRWQVDGVKTDVDGAGVTTRFVICVGPKEETK